MKQKVVQTYVSDNDQDNDGIDDQTDMLGAGYDIMELVNQDIIQNPTLYDIETPDKKIDFRRVRNLYVYLSSHAISLTTDVFDIEEWQGGDIVVFEKHIGVISDNRNENGIFLCPTMF